MRFLSRFLSLICLVAAVLAGVVDSVQSVASQTVSLTTFGSALFSLNPALLETMETYALTNFGPVVWNSTMAWILLQPAFAVLLVLSLIFWVVAFRREPAAGRFAA